MAWTKHFKTAGTVSAASVLGNGRQADPGYRNYQSALPEVYVGHPNRVERYSQYENMDLDSEVNSAMDILAEFCTQNNTQNGTAFEIFFKDQATDSEIKILKEQLQKWYTLNELDKRMFKLIRNVLKYGDQVFLRDPETFKLFWVEMSKVSKVIVNETQGKEPEQYCIQDLAPNFENLTATTIGVMDNYINSPNTGGAAGAYTQPTKSYTGGSRFGHSQNDTAINAEHVLHLSLSEGLDVNWPFGTSVLENIFKVFKQKELLEDAIIIYRVQRAPERRVFYIDVGSMPSHMAMSFVERVKNEVHQRRIPTQSGGGTNMMDATYNPLSTNEDYFFPQTAEGRGSKVDTLPGGQNLGEIDDLRFFTNKMFRGLRIPSSYLPTGPEDGSQSVTDGKVGTALIQEWRFNQYCKRLQKSICENLDTEFKMFLRWRGFNIDSSLFELRFNEPQNFASYKQAEVDSSRIQGFTQLEQYPYLSKRFLLQRYLGLTEEEMQENEEMWKEENKAGSAAGASAGLRGVGITPGAIDGDIDNVTMPELDDGELDVGGEAAPGAATPSPLGNSIAQASEPATTAAPTA